MDLPIISKTLYDNKMRAYRKEYKCNKCNHTTHTLWNLKKHTADTHKTIKEKYKLPYYCKICDSISISKSYYETHLNSNDHINKIQSLLYVKPLKEEILEKEYNIDENIKKYIDDCIRKMKDDIINKLML